MTSSPTVPRSPAAPSRPRRSLAPDISRGLMLALIAMANVSWYLWGHEGSVGMSPHVPAMGPLDSAVQFVMTVAVDHRAMPLFAFLFGYGMVQFYRSRIDRGMEAGVVRIMMRRRHWAMLLLGFLHAALLFYGDILGAYAVAALLLVWIFFGRRTRTLAIWLIVLTSIMVLYALFSAVSALVLAFLAPPEALAEMEAGMAGFGMGFIRDLAYGQPYLISILTRTGMWLFALVPAVFMGPPLMILLGWIAARHRVLDEPWRHVRLLRRVAIGGIAIGWLGGLPDALTYVGVLPMPEAVAWGFVGITSVSGMACGVGYAAAFGLLAARLEKHGLPAAALSAEGPASRSGATAEQTPAQRAYGVPAATDMPVTDARPGPLVRALSAVGQRSLTFYLFQSLLLAPIMAGWGFGLGAQLSTAPAVAIALAVWMVSLPIAAFMDSRSLRGPAEMLLRRMTYGRHERRERLAR
ncbi:DUF418 domain-containing protein [Brachybacterium sp. GCM10030268]|uniref:DUF418 domain-containing protein n=1 Tax=Brachybacterium sp. GCM10030268 TaxID=3273382 RepID=UPI003616FB67